MGAFNTSIIGFIGGLGPIAVEGLHLFLLDPEVENKSKKKSVKGPEEGDEQTESQKKYPARDVE